MAASPFVAEIIMVPFNFAPTGWALCDGQLLPISSNTALFSLLGTTYGGDGKSNFALPNLQGCVPMHPGQGPGLSLHDLGETGGTETVTLLQTEMPAHSHTIDLKIPAGGAANTGSPVNGYPAVSATDNLYATTTSGNSGTIQPQVELLPAGASFPHNNMQPSLTVNFIIALQGVYPPRT